jgi:hypothetical protein
MSLAGAERRGLVVRKARRVGGNGKKKPGGRRGRLR